MGLIEKLAPTLNQFMEQTTRSINGHIAISDNLEQTLVEITVTVDSNGTPLLNNKFRVEGTGGLSGVICTKAINLTVSTNYPTSTPFLSILKGTTQITVNNISGLQANEKYKLTLLLL